MKKCVLGVVGVLGASCGAVGLNADFSLAVEGGLCTAVAEARRTLGACVVECSEAAPVHGFTEPFFAPGGYGADWWQLDSSSALEGCKWFDFSFAERALLNFERVQKPDGRIPLYGPDTLPKSSHHSRQSDNASSLPALFRSAHDIAVMKGDAVFAARVKTTLKKYLDWWFAARLDASTGLMGALFEETFPPYLGVAGEWSGVDTCVEVAHGAELTADLARRLGEASEAASLEAAAGRLYAAVHAHMWNAADGTFRPVALPSGTFGLASAEGFGMFRDPDLPTEMRTRLRTALTGPRFGWAAYPLTSAARDDPAFAVTRGDSYQFNASWSGMVWTLVNIRVVEALSAAGLTEESTRLAERTVAMIDAAGEFREFYDPNDGSGHGARNYAWTAAHYLELVVRDLLGIRYDGFTRELTVKPRIPHAFRLTGLDCGGHARADVTCAEGRIVCRFRNVIGAEPTLKEGTVRTFDRASFVLPADPWLHVDAKATNSLDLADVDGVPRVRVWRDVRGEGHPVATAPCDAARPVYRAEKGIPCVDFGELVFGNPSNGHGCALDWSAPCTNILAAFIVFADTATSQYAQNLIGRTTTTRELSFWRGQGSPRGEGALLYETDPAVCVSTAYAAGSTRFDGAAMTNLVRVSPGAFHIVSTLLSRSGSGDAFARDAVQHGGGLKIAECIVYDRALTETERWQVDAYLADRWLDCRREWIILLR